MNCDAVKTPITPPRYLDIFGCLKSCCDRNGRQCLNLAVRNMEIVKICRELQWFLETTKMKAIYTCFTHVFFLVATCWCPTNKCNVVFFSFMIFWLRAKFAFGLELAFSQTMFDYCLCVTLMCVLSFVVLCLVSFDPCLRRCPLSSVIFCLIGKKSV